MSAVSEVLLTNELFVEILILLPSRDLERARRVDRRWRSVIDDTLVVQRVRCLRPIAIGDVPRSTFDEVIAYERSLVPVAKGGTLSTGPSASLPSAPDSTAHPPPVATGSTARPVANQILAYTGVQMYPLEHGVRGPFDRLPHDKKYIRPWAWEQLPGLNPNQSHIPRYSGKYMVDIKVHPKLRSTSIKLRQLSDDGDIPHRIAMYPPLTILRAQELEHCENDFAMLPPIIEAKLQLLDNEADVAPTTLRVSSGIKLKDIVETQKELLGSRKWGNREPVCLASVVMNVNIDNLVIINV